MKLVLYTKYPVLLGKQAKTDTYGLHLRITHGCVATHAGSKLSLQTNACVCVSPDVEKTQYRQANIVQNMIQSMFLMISQALMSHKCKKSENVCE